MTPVAVEAHYLVRTRTFERRAVIHVLDELIDLLNLDRSTGQIIIHVTQGGIGGLSFEERQRIALPSDTQ